MNAQRTALISLPWIALALACLGGCCAPRGTRAELEPPVFELSRIDPEAAAVAFRFPEDTLPPFARHSVRYVETPVNVEILATDEWLPVFTTQDFTLVASSAYHERICEALLDAQVKAQPGAYSGIIGFIFGSKGNFRARCLKTRDYLLFVDARETVIGWSRLESRYTCPMESRLRNPAPLASDVWPDGPTLRVLPRGAKASVKQDAKSASTPRSDRRPRSVGTAC